MATEHDPEGREPQALLAAADFKNARVLEIGCGDGRLTFRYAGSARGGKMRIQWKASAPPDWASLRSSFL